MRVSSPRKKNSKRRLSNKKKAALSLVGGMGVGALLLNRYMKHDMAKKAASGIQTFNSNLGTLARKFQTPNMPKGGARL